MRFARGMFLCIILCLMLLLFVGCEHIEINGIENFSEYSCDKGLNYNLLPKNQEFLTEYPYLEAEYRYWTDGWYSQYKTIVRIQYSKEMYESAKAACQSVYPSSSEIFTYEGYRFSSPRFLFDGGDGLQIFGYEDETCTLLFIGSYGFISVQSENLNDTTLEDFIKTEFEIYG